MNFTKNYTLVIFTIILFLLSSCVPEQNKKNKKDKESEDNILSFQKVDIIEDNNSVKPSNNFANMAMTNFGSVFTRGIYSDGELTRFPLEGESWIRVGYCNQLAARIATPLKLILKQVAYETKEIIDKDSSYISGSDKRTYIGDLGGCPISSPENKAAGIYQHDDGGNFHRLYAASDFLYYTKKDSNYTQIMHYRKPFVDIYDSKGKLQHSDWIRQAIFLKRIREVFPNAIIWMASQFYKEIRDKLTNPPQNLRPLLGKLDLLNGYTPVLTGTSPDDAYNHDKHLHIYFGKRAGEHQDFSQIEINLKTFESDEWYFNKSDLNSYAKFNGFNKSISGDHAIIFPVANEAGAHYKYPVKCDGNYLINTTGNFYKLECDTGLIEMNSCPQGISANGEQCPFIHPGPVHNAKKCFGAICSGVNGSLEQIANQRRKSTIDYSNLMATKKYCCKGTYTIDLSGDKWDWQNGCSTGWVTANTISYKSIIDEIEFEFEECNFSGVVTGQKPVINLFTANNSKNVQLEVNDQVDYQWEITDATKIESFYSVNKTNGCGHTPNENLWHIKTASGLKRGTIDPCMSDSTYTLKIVASNKFGSVTSDPVTVKIIKEVEDAVTGKKPTINIFTANNLKNIQLKALDQIDYRWEITNATKIESFYKVNKTNDCGHTSNDSPWHIKTASGLKRGTIDPCMSDSTYTLKIVASNQFGSVTSDPIVLRVIKVAAEATPRPTLTPTPRPTLTPTPRPTLTPTPRPTLTPIPRPTLTPTPRPTLTPAPMPTIDSNKFLRVIKPNSSNNNYFTSLNNLRNQAKSLGAPINPYNCIDVNNPDKLLLGKTPCKANYATQVYCVSMKNVGNLTWHYYLFKCE